MIHKDAPIISLILQTATRFVFALLLLLAIFLLLRGHNEPGGGFIGGLVAAIAFVLYAIAFDVPAARTMLRLDPHMLIGTGLLVAVAAGVVPFFYGHAFLTGEWAYVPIPGLGETYLGTPLLFDIGVFMVVIGITLVIVLTLLEE